MPKKHGIGTRILAAVVSVIFTCSVTVTAFAVADTLHTTVTDGEKSVSISSKTNDPKEIVRLAGFITNANDELDLSDFSADKGGTIVIERARVLRIEDNGLVSYFVGYSGSIEKLFKEKGFPFNDGDELNIDPAEMIFDGMRLVVKRAFSVQITCDGKTEKLAIADGTVADAIEKAGITIGEDDIVSPDPATELCGYSEIRIYRVSYEVVSEEEEIPFGTDVVYDNDMYVGESAIESKGIPGTKVIYSNAKIIDGVIAESEYLREEIAAAPVNEVKRVGTRSRDVLSEYKGTISPISELDLPDDIKLDANGIPVNYKYKEVVRSTAYTGDPETASGRKPMAGHVAVDPNKYPYGTKLFITSADGSYVYGYCIAADTGGFVAMDATDVDLYMNNEEMCMDWGRRNIAVYVL